MRCVRTVSLHLPPPSSPGLIDGWERSGNIFIVVISKEKRPLVTRCRKCRPPPSQYSSLSPNPGHFRWDLGLFPHLARQWLKRVERLRRAYVIISVSGRELKTYFLERVHLLQDRTRCMEGVCFEQVHLIKKKKKSSRAAQRGVYRQRVTLQTVNRDWTCCCCCCCCTSLPVTFINSFWVCRIIHDKEAALWCAENTDTTLSSNEVSHLMDSWKSCWFYTD